MTFLSVLIALGFLYAAFSLRKSTAPANTKHQDPHGPLVAIVQGETWEGPVLLWRGYYAEAELARTAAAHEAFRLDRSLAERPEFGLSMHIEDRRKFERRLAFGYQRSFDRPREFSRFLITPTGIGSRG